MNDRTKPAPTDASPAPSALDPQEAHDAAVRWLLAWRLTGCVHLQFTAEDLADPNSPAWQSVTENFKKTWPRDYLRLVDAVRNGLKSPDDTTAERAIEQAALLTETEFAQDRRWIADALGITVSELDRFVKEKRGSRPDDINFRSLGIPIVEPWPEAADGASLLDEVARTLRRFIAFDRNADADVLAVWSLGTHCFELFNIFPRVAVTSPEKECGKSTVLAVLALLVARPVMSSNVTPAVVFRVVEEYRPTLLIDELDTFLKDDKNELDGLFNSGHHRNGFAWRVEKINEKLVPCRFATFAPLAFGLIGRPKETLGSRSLSIWMLRKDGDQHVERLDPDEEPAQVELFERLRRQLLRWAKDNAKAIQEQHPEANGLGNRAYDNWRPLLKIAGVVGGDWPAKIRAAAGDTSTLAKVDDSDAVRLLRDVRNILHTRNVAEIPSAVLVADLLRQRESGWHHYRNERDPLDQRDLGKLLSHFSIESKNIRFKKDQLELFRLNTAKPQLRGYELKQFETLFTKFLQGETPEEVELND